MRIIIQKFGGTSVATAESRQQVVRKVQQALEKGYAPIVVVSAMGRKGAPYATDTLIALAKDVYAEVAPRELDQIMHCGELISSIVMTSTLQAAGVPAKALTGGQAGMVTNEDFCNAHILKVDTCRLRRELEAGFVPVVCGFQGMSANGEITTIGRGGSDTSAAAFGAALDAELVEIYTDVDGIMTADPRIVKQAKMLECISYEEVCQLAHQGAKVIHPRAVELVMPKNSPMVIKSTFSDNPGTLSTHVTQECTDGVALSDRVASGVTYLAHIAHVKVAMDAAQTGTASKTVFQAMAQHGISVDLINVHPGQIMFTVADAMREKAQGYLQELGLQVETREDCAMVSVVGGGMGEVPGVMASFVEALAENDIMILQTVDSQTSISVLVQGTQMVEAVTALHEKFALAD